MFEAERCGVMGKEMFRTRADAKQALRTWAYGKGSRKIHRCIFCDKYHLTKGDRSKGKGSR